MEIQRKFMPVEGIKFFVEEEGKEVAHAYLYLLMDDSNPEPIGFMNKIYGREEYAELLVQDVIKEARQRRCSSVRKRQISKLQ